MAGIFQNYNHIELEVLQEHAADLTSVIATNPSLFGQHLVQRGLAVQTTVTGIVDTVGINDYRKGSTLLSLVDSKLRTTGTKENARRYFNDFLLIIANPMGQRDLGELLVATFKSKDPSYTSPRPLQEGHVPSITSPGNQPPSPTSADITVGDLIIFSGEAVGQGAFGTVFKGRWKTKVCAAKMLNILGNQIYAGVSITQSSHLVQKDALTRFQRECEFMKTLMHPNIVAYYDTLIHPWRNLPILVMELMETSLRCYVKTTENVSRKIQIYLCCNIASALKYLHDRNLVHRDLCGDNILLKSCDDVIPVAKVTDFGMSRVIKNRTDLSHSLTAMNHRRGYLPPEAPEYPTDYDASLDIFMFAAVMTQIASKSECIESKEHRQKLVDQLDKTRHPLKPVISLCLSEKKECRPLASKLFVCLQYACESLASEGDCSLDEDEIAHNMQQLCIEQVEASCKSLDQPLELKDHFNVQQYLRDMDPDQLRQLGLALGLHYPTLKKMDSLPDDLIHAWLLRQESVMDNSGEPTYNSLAKVLDTIGQTGLAQDVREQKHANQS